MKNKLNTFKFFISRIKSLTPKVFVYQGLFAVLRTIEILFVMYLPSILIILLTGSFNLQQVITYLMVGLTLLWIIRISNRIIIKENALLENSFSQELIKDLSYRITTTQFSKVEDSEFVAKKEEAMFPIKTQNAIQNTFRSIPIVFQSVVILASVLAILLVYEPILMVIAIVVAVSSFIVSQKMIRYEAEQAKSNARKNSEYVYYLRTMRDSAIAKDVRIYRMQPYFAEKYKSLFTFIVKSTKKLYASREYRGLINQMLSVILMIFIYGFLVYKVTTSSMEISIFVLLVNATLSFNDQMNVFFSEILMLNQQLIYLDSLKQFYSMLSTNQSIGKEALKEPIHSVEFKNVTFRYPKTDANVLNNCSFKIDGTKNLSIVGRNGSGKTTIIKLLSRLYEPQEGEILVNGKNIKYYEESSYLKQLSIIFQDFKTFKYSIRENIIFDSQIDEKQFSEAIEKSELSKELCKFPSGVDTNLVRDIEDVKSVTLSKGQEQKLVIARSIYGKGSLLILDEPTASLDPIAEEEVYQHFQSITKDKLAIFISHRLSSCRFSDTIIYLEDGFVKELGSHQQLLRLNGKYASLFNLQASKYQ